MPESPAFGSLALARPRYHLLASAAIGGALWLRTGSRKAALAPLATGFLVDLDHFVDYVATRRTAGRESMYLALHGWEYVPVWWAIDRLLGLRGGGVLGYLAHISIDQLWNPTRSRWAYFVTWRARQGFHDHFGPPDPSQRHKWRRASLLGLLRWF